MTLRVSHENLLFTMEHRDKDYRGIADITMMIRGATFRRLNDIGVTAAGGMERIGSFQTRGSRELDQGNVTVVSLQDVASV